jgi:alpha-ketoglutarate-dependent taurine dioxygenase
VHPLVRTNPATGWKSLYVNQAMTVGIEGLDKKESDAILNHLYESVLPPHLLKAPEDFHTDDSGHGPNQCV